ncbi:MAG: hypothetical protein AMXMBFR57_16770 [Acidimicrobiia bacterium]
MGHLMRCLALAQEWSRQGGDVTFVAAGAPQAFAAGLRSAGWDLVCVDSPHPDPGDWQQMSRTLGKDHAAIVVVDGYHFDLEYQRHITGAGHRLLNIDDAADRDGYAGDVLLNQNVHAAAIDYPSDAPRVRLLGPEFALIRAEFPRGESVAPRWPPQARRLLVTLGGSDRRNHTTTILLALNRVTLPLEINVAIGPGNPHRALLAEAIRTSVHEVIAHENVTDMSALMASSDFAITAAGSTCWELALMGVPMLALVVADNQWSLAEELQRRGAAVSLGWYGDLRPEGLAATVARLAEDEEARRHLSRSAMALVDGRGASRVVAALSALH